jgi:hypothetical protein
MITDHDRAVLENAADLLEELGHAGAGALRELIRTRDERLDQVAGFVLDGGHVRLSPTFRKSAISSSVTMYCRGGELGHTDHTSRDQIVQNHGGAERLLDTLCRQVRSLQTDERYPNKLRNVGRAT